MFKNVASQKLTVFAFADAGHASLDAGDRVTGDAANITCKIEQDDDGTQTASNDTNPTEVEDGQYRFDLTQAETNGDKLTFYPESSTAGVQVIALPSSVIYTRSANFPDFSVDANGRTDVGSFGGTTGTFSAGRPEVNTTHAAGTAWGSSSITAAALATDAVQEIRDAITGGTYALDTDANGRIRIVDGTGAGELDTASGLISGIAGTKNTLDDLNDITTAQVNTEADNAIVTYGLDHLLSTSVTGTDVANNSIFARLVSKSVTADWDDFVNTTESLQAIKDLGDTNWITATGFSTHTAANVRTEMDSNSTQLAAILADTNELQGDWTNGGRLDLIIDAILDDTGTSGVVLTSTGLATNAVEEIRNAITGGAYALDTDANGRMRVVDGTAAGEIALTSGLIDGITGTLNTLDALDTAQDSQHSTTQTNISNLNDVSTADINAQVLDVLNVDTFTEPGQGVPTATPTMREMLHYMYKQWRNKKTETSTTQSLYNDAGTTVDQQATVSDDGTTATIEEWVSG